MPAMDTLLFNDPEVKRSSRSRSSRNAVPQAFGLGCSAPGERRDDSAKADGRATPPTGARRERERVARATATGNGALDRRGRRHPQIPKLPRLVASREGYLIDATAGWNGRSSRRWRDGVSQDIGDAAWWRPSPGRARREVDVSKSQVSRLCSAGCRGGHVQGAALRRGALRYLLARRHLREVPRGEGARH